MRTLAIAAGLLYASAASAEDDAPRVIRGTEKGYAVPIVVADVSAALVIPAVILPTWSSNPWIWSIPLSDAPLVLTAPFMHVAHERYVAAVVSFFGWSSVVASSWAVGGVLAMLWRPQCSATQFGQTCSSTQDLSMLGAGLGMATGILGTAGMTLLDAWMARSFKRTHLGPSVGFDTRSATAGLLGSF